MPLQHFNISSYKIFNTFASFFFAFVSTLDRVNPITIQCTRANSNADLVNSSNQITEK